jgi:tetratricopeptide (TPR) repeat protein
MRRHTLISTVGIAWTLLYAACVVWLYATAPRTLDDLRTEASATVGTYAVDEARFQSARELFQREQYRAAREEWVRADPARRDARTQFYIAYAFYREGWGRVYNDRALFRQGLEAIDLAIKLSPDAALTVDDPDLRIHSAAELKAELEQGTETTWGDFNPAKVFRERK